MSKLTFGEIREVTKGTLIGDENEGVSGICTDSRIYDGEELFVALKGEVQDAHRFIPTMIDKGCRGFLISDRSVIDESRDDINFVIVNDTLVALQAMTRYYLDKTGMKKLAITGSVGKTSTRDMAYQILSQRYKTGRPIKNYNSDVGIPLTVFGFDEDVEIAVLEEGMEHMGEIHRLVDMTRPDVAIITNVGVTHIENVGTRENLLKGKMEITDFFGPENTLVINSTNDMMAKATFGDYRVLRAGTDKTDDFLVTDIVDRGIDGTSFRLVRGEESVDVDLPMPGAHNAINAALAAAGCSVFGVTLEEVKKGLEITELTGRRLKIREGSGVRVLDDSYNAAPDSVRSAILTLEKTPAKRRVVILGNMNELGEGSRLMHRQVGEYAAEHGIDLVIGIEEKAKDIVEGAESMGASTLYYSSKEDLYSDLWDVIEDGDLILIKASMTRHLWEVTEKIMEGPGGEKC